MKFTKMQGLGNDYVYVNCFEEKIENPPAVARYVSDRHFGIGSDGLIMINPSEVADFEMEMYNADGSRGEMCGNGIRCVAKYVYDYGLTDKTQISVETLGGIKYLDLTVEDGKVVLVKVDMGKPELKSDLIPIISENEKVIDEPIEVDGQVYHMTGVSMGNPHTVIYVDDVKNLDLEKIGPKFENHERFPKRINTEFVHCIDRNTVEMRVWERGSGETLACGTGACAVAVASILNNLTDTRVTVKLLGGDLQIEWDQEKNHVFMTGPALLLAKLTPDSLDVTFWLVVVLIYYFLATLLPIDKIIGKIYPLFGACLIIMAVGVSSGIILGGWQMPEMTLQNLHPKDLPIWPLMFITVACGATSGFHATQSPLMARCMKEEKNGRVVFYGAMVAEGIIALIWASAGIAFYETTGGLAAAIASAGPGGVVYDVSFGTLGTVGGILAMIGVIACPITSGDTAFRSARYTLSDWFKIDQVSYTKRLALAIPLLGIGGILSQMNFDIIWRYFSWANQTLAMIALWTGAMYLWKQNKGGWQHYIAVIPAIFMTMVTFTYILQAPEGFGLPTSITYPAGVIITIFWAIVYFKSTIFKK